MAFTDQGFWYPEQSPKQLEIYNCYNRYVLASGPKKSGKTIGNLHRIVRHAFEIDGARVAMFAKTVKNAKAGGIWNDMTDLILPEWLNAGIGLEYTTKKSDGTMGVKQDAQTRMMYFRIRNAHGGESEFQLHSIDNEKEVESIAKGTRFSCFYFAELSNFKNRLVFDITSDQLRMPGLDFNQHIWIADTNPPDDGPDHWIHDVWYKLAAKKEKAPHEEFLCKHLRLIEVMIEDNPYLSNEERADLYVRFAHDPDLYARYILGKYVRATKGAIFSDQFNPDVHVVGDTSALDDKDWQILMPSEHCIELMTGWDLGDKFHSCHILEPIEQEGVDGRTYCVLDEINHLDATVDLGLREFSEAVMIRIELWEKYLGKQPGWRHWSDSAALTNFRSGAETYDKNLIYKYSEGRIQLEASPKFPGSIRKRIQIVKILLYENRLLVSAGCLRTIDMFKSLKKGTGAKVIMDSIYRHVFDSLSYSLASMEPELLIQDIDEETEKGGRLVSISALR